MQVPVVMTTSMGQTISTVSMQQAPGHPGAPGHAALLTNASPIGTATGCSPSQQKVSESINQKLPLCSLQFSAVEKCCFHTSVIAKQDGLSEPIREGIP